MKRLASGLAAVVLSMLPFTARAQDGVYDTPSALGVVESLYDAVTFGPGSPPDWDFVRSLFLPEAVVVLRTGRDATTVFTVDGFVADFERFIAQADILKTGFEESIQRTSVMEYGDMAHVLVLYHAHIPGSERPPQAGVDSFSLTRRDGRWLIASVVNELPMKAGAPPAALRDS